MTLASGLSFMGFRLFIHKVGVPLKTLVRSFLGSYVLNKALNGDNEQSRTVLLKVEIGVLKKALQEKSSGHLPDGSEMIYILQGQGGMGREVSQS
jgi:hypothetical protein